MIATLLTLDAGFAFFAVVIVVLIAVTAHDAIRPSPDDPQFLTERYRSLNDDIETPEGQRRVGL